jgi:transposase
MKQYSADLRERLLGAIDAGLPQVEAARLFSVSVSSIKRWRQQVQQTGSLVARTRTGRRRRVRPEEEATLLAQVAAAPDATLAEHGAAWAASTGVHLSTATMSRTLARLDQPQKKSR